MPITLETIAIEFGAQWTGGGTINRILTDMSRVARATKEIYNPVTNTSMVAGTNAQAERWAAAGAAALRYQSTIQMVERQITQLGQVMTGSFSEKNPFANLAGNEAGQVAKYRELATEANLAKSALAGIQTGAGGAAAKISAMLSKIVPVTVALGGLTIAAVGVAKAFGAWKDMAEEGAGVRQVAKSFEHLTQSIYGVPDLLEKMRIASNGTISDFQLMSSYMTLIAGTTPEFGRSISQAVPQLLEIAKAANTLNPALGDTTFFFESLARGIKRTEYRLVDNLGLNVRVGEANKRYAAELGKTVQELTAVERQQAFLNEVLRAGGQLIEQLGGNVNSLTDPYQQLTANTENLSNALKSLASLSFAPMISSLSGFTGELSETFTSFTKAILDLNDAAKKSGDVEPFFEGMSKWLYLIVPGGPIVAGLDSITDKLRTYNDLIADIRSGDSLGEAITNARYGDFSAPFSADKPTELARQIEAASAAFQRFKESAAWALHNGREIGTSLGEIGKGAQLSESKVAALANAFAKLNLLARQNMKREYQADTVRDTIKQIKALEQLSRVQAYYAKSLDNIYSSDEWTAYQQANHDLAEATTAAWAKIEAARQMAQTQSWLDIFAGGEFNSEMIIGDIRNIGAAWVSTGGATQEQSDKLAELNKQLERTREKLWDVQNGIGVQGDKSEATAKKIADLSAEVANYERVIGQLNSEIAPTSVSRVQFGLDINDVEAYRSLVTVLGELGGTTSQLSGISVALGLISPAAADAMMKVSLLDSALRAIAMKVQVGEITVEGGAEAAKSVIAQLEEAISYEELVVNVRTSIAETRQQNIADWRELKHMGEDTTQFDINANIDPATRALGEVMGFISTSESKIAVDADLEPFRQAVNEAKSAVDAMRVTLTIRGVYVPPDNLPGNSTSTTTTTTTGGATPYATGGYVGGGRNRAVAAVVHGGEFVMRPEAVDRLGVGFLNALNRGLYSSNNQVTLQNNFYAPIGDSSDVRQVIVKSGDDAAEQLVNTLKRSGYRI